MQGLKLIFIAMAVAATYSLNAQDIHSLSLGTVSVDGNPDEWPQPFRYYEGTTKLQFSFANDTANLYVCIKVTDAQTQLRLFNSGLNICIDPKGKKKQTITLSFPVKPEGDAGESSGGQRHHHQGSGGGMDADQSAQKTDLLRLKHHARMQQLTIRVKGFVGLPEQVLPLQNAYHITAAFDWDSLDILSIEYKLPLPLIMGHSLSAIDTVKPIAVGFFEPAPEVQHAGNGGVPEGEQGAGDVSNSNNSMNRGGMGGGMNGGGMGGGGMGGHGGGGHGGGGHMQDTNPANQEQKVWSKVFLNYKI